MGEILDIFVYNSPRYFLQNFESVGLLVKEFKMDFQGSDHGSHLGFPI